MGDTTDPLANGIVEQGTQVRFLNGDEPIIRGIVNGAPLVCLVGGVVKTFVPVHDPGFNRNMVVNAENIVGKWDDAHDADVARIAAYSRRV